MMKGHIQMSARLRKIAKQYSDEEIAKAEQAEADIEVIEMQKRTPVDTRPNAPHPGQLRDSIHRDETVVEGNRIKTIIATSQQVADENNYDLHVHENPDAFHPIGQWKYMESVLNESRSSMGQRLADRLHFNKTQVK